MRAVIQRVLQAKVEVDSNTIGHISSGWLVFLGVSSEDEDADVDYITNKILNLRGFADGDGRFELSALEASKDILLVSQFTLYGDCRKGRRPSFTESAPPLEAKLMYEKCLSKLKMSGLKVESGRFQAMMQVSLVNDGPVTLLLDSQKKF